MDHYQLIDHTADIGIHVTGADVRQLFINAGLAMFDLIADTHGLHGTKKRRTSVQGQDWPDLMVVWLRELLYFWSGKQLLVTSIDIETIAPFSISARVDCVSFIVGQHEIRHDIKAVTYHQIEVRHASRGWGSTVIFDV